VAVHGTVTVTCLLLGVGSWEFVWYVHPVGSPALGIPRSFWYGGVSVGLLLMAFHSLTNGCLVLFGQREIVREALPSEEALRLHWDAELPPPDAQGGRS
jgi:TRAP-type C4-dicarboxylate transport system permease small subunit